MKKFYLLIVLLSVFINLNLVTAQVGSTCANADVITSLPVNFAGMSTSGTGSNYDSGPCGSNNYMSGNDYVFSYTPVANELVKITLSNTGTGVGVFVTSSCPDDTLAFCIGQATSPTGNPSITNLYLYAGYTYYILVSTYNLLGMNPSTDFDFSMEACTDIPVASFSFTQDSLDISFTNTSANASSYVWYFGDELIILPPPLGGDTSANPVHTFANYGSFEVTLFVYSACGLSDTMVMPVNVVCPGIMPQPSFTYTVNDLTVDFTNVSSNADSYLWFYGDEPGFPPATGDTTVNPTHVYAQYGTYEVQLIATNWCGSDTLTDSLTLVCPFPNPPVASFTFVQDSLDVTFVNTSTDAQNYVWYFGDELIILPPPYGGDTATNPEHTYQGYNTYTVTLIASNGCGMSDTIETPISMVCPGVMPVASFTYTETGTAVTFTNNSTNAESYLWFYGDEPGFPPATGDTTVNPTHVYAQYGNYVVQLIATNWCGSDTLTDSLTLVCPYPNPPVASFTIIQDSLDVTFVNTTTDAQNYVWYFGDEPIILPPPFGGDTAINPTHSYAGYDSYTVTLIASNLCGMSDTIEMHINVVCPGVMPVASFSYTEYGTVVAFTNSSSNAESYLWFYGDEPVFPPVTGDTAINPVHFYAQYGTYEVQLIVTNWCGSDTLTDSLTLVCPFPYPPVASFTYVQDTLDVTFTNTTVGAQNYVWYFGDEPIILPPPFGGDTAVNPLHAYQGYGSYEVTLIATNLCGISDTLTDTITLVCPFINPPAASFTYIQDSLDVTFVNTSDDAQSYIWYFGDEPIILPPPFGGDTAVDPAHTYAAYDTYTVTLIASNLCGISDTIETPITLICPGVMPVASFSYSIAGNNVAFANNSISAESYLWFFGDEPIFPPAQGDTTPNPLHTYFQTGTYEVQLIATNLCGSDTLIDTLQILCTDSTPPVASFTYTVNDLTVTFTNTSTDANHSLWYFGDEPVVLPPPYGGDTTTHPAHTYTGNGTYDVKLIVYSLCGFTDTLVIPITINCTAPLPEASFIYVEDSTNLSVAFDNTSTNTSHSLWYFGDEAVILPPPLGGDTTTNPIHTYPDTGTYNVTLIVYNQCEATDTLVFPIIITCTAPAPLAAFSYIQDSLQVSFINTSTGADNYLWYFGDEAVILPPPLGGDTNSNPIHTYPDTGIYNVTLIAYNTCGVTDTLEFPVDVTCTGVPPTASFTYTKNGLAVSFTNTSAGATSYKWLFGDEPSVNWNLADTTHNPVHTYVQFGTYLVRMMAINNCGTDTSTVQIVLTGIDEITKQTGFTCYPNPAKTFINICISENSLINPQLSVFNLLGAEIYRENLPDISGVYVKQLDIRNLAKGVYYVKVNSNNGTLTKLIIVE